MNVNDPLSLRRLTENEAMFRKQNEKIELELAKLTEMAVQDGHMGYSTTSELLLKFYCECCDEKCRERVELTVSKYRDIHENRKRFVVLPGHDVFGLEKVVVNHGTYSEVEKKLAPPEDPKTLHASQVQNV